MKHTLILLCLTFEYVRGKVKIVKKEPRLDMIRYEVSYYGLNHPLYYNERHCKHFVLLFEEESIYIGFFSLYYWLLKFLVKNIPVTSEIKKQKPQLKLIINKNFSKNN